MVLEVRIYKIREGMRDRFVEFFDERGYCAARLQTLDHGQPISVYTVSRELGHTSTDMVQRIYAHLGAVRHRSEVVKYRVEQHEEVLGAQLAALRSLRPPEPIYSARVLACLAEFG